MADSEQIMREALLQEGVSAALATVHVINAAGLFHRLPADAESAERHNHGAALLAMLEDKLTSIQQEFDGLDRPRSNGDAEC